MIAIVSHLRDAGREIFEALSRLSNALLFFFGLISSKPLIELAVGAMSCLYALTQSNNSFLEQLSSNPEWLKLLSGLKSKPSSLGMAACGVSFNLAMQYQRSYTPIADQMDINTDYFRILIISLRDYLMTTSTEHDSSGSLHLALEALSSITISPTRYDPETTQKTKFRRISEESEEFGGLEDDDEDENMQLEDDQNESKINPVSGDGSFHIDDMDIEMSNRNESTSATSPWALYDADFLSNEALPLLTGLAVPSASFSHEFQEGAILVLISIFSALLDAKESLPDSTIKQLEKDWAPSLWKSLISPGLKEKDPDPSFATNITNLAIELLECSHRKYIQPQDEDVRVFMGFYARLTDTPEAFEDPAEDRISTLGDTIFEVLSQIALEPCPVPTNQTIGSFLINALIKVPTTPIPCVIAALDGLFLIYADKAYSYDEPVFRGQGFLSMLEQIRPNLIKLSKSVDKRREPDMKGILQESVRELGRFIKYKNDELGGKV